MQRQLCCLLMTLLFHMGTAIAEPSAKAQSKSPTLSTESAKRLPAKHQAIPKSQRLKLQQNIDSYQHAISKLESEEGVYGNAITEKLSSLGMALQYNGEHAKAIKVFKRAIHLNRINEGLYTTGQVPMLQRLIASHMALGQWKDVSDRYRYLYWLNTQNYGKNDPRILPALGQLSKWHLRAYGMRFGRDRETVTNHLITAHNYIERSISLLEQVPENEDRLIKELNGLTLTNYLFATYQRTASEKVNSGLPVDPELRHTALVIDQYISRSFRSGKNALNRVIDIYANSDKAPPWAVAKAKVKMADWLFLFNKRSSAFALYHEAYNMMTEEEASHQQLKQIFDRPVALPNMDLIDNGTYDQNKAIPDDRNYVLASFDVTPQGKAANIEIIESRPQDNISARSQVKRSLRIAKFRPRFVGGEPTLTEKMKLRVLSR